MSDCQAERWDRINSDGGEYLQFAKIEKPRSSRPDLHAFLLLDSKKPGSNRDMVSAAEHDEIFLDFDPDDLALLSDDEILELIRCGVRLDKSVDSLAMFA